MTTLKRPATQALAGVVIGAFVLIVVTAILASAITTAEVAGNLRTATSQLEGIRKTDAADEAARIERSAKVAAQLALLQRQNVEQVHQAKVQRRYLAQLSRALRQHGIPVPNPPRVTVTPRPKAPRHHRNPGAPGPTGPTPSPNSNMACQLVPVLCDGLPLGLPPLLPKPLSG